MINTLKYWGCCFVKRRSKWLRYVTERAAIRVVSRRVSHAIGHDVSMISSYTLPFELATLFDLAMELPDGAAALEIGSHLGKSACFIGAALQAKRGRLYCVDTWQNETMPDGLRDTYEEFCRNTTGLAALIIPIRKRSDQLAPGEVPATVHLAFIDGDHSFEGVRNDFERVAPLIPVGGTIVFHDAVRSTFLGVGQVIGGALATGQWTIGGQAGSLFWICRVKDE
jgi:predicted O-methyltransferase YrrM